MRRQEARCREEEKWVEAARRRKKKMHKGGREINFDAKKKVWGLWTLLLREKGGVIKKGGKGGFYHGEMGAQTLTCALQRGGKIPLSVGEILWLGKKGVVFLGKKKVPSGSRRYKC